ncbi:MAG: metallophosphoesterase [Planctomycetota bacterium]
MFKDEYSGLLLIGDPHIEARQPGFRKDNFAETVLGKIRWCLEVCENESLLPVFLGDLFDKPRGNPNWLISRLIEIMSVTPSIGIYGNHDCADVELDENDSLSILIAAGCLRLVSELDPFRTRVHQRDVIIGGSSYRAPIPTTFHLPKRRAQGLFDNDPFVLWLTHHDIGFPGYDNNRIDPHQISNVELLVNGHIHRPLESVKAGRTLWMTPGNITRRSRSEAVRDHVPAVTRIDVMPEDYKISTIEVPHAPFDEVFHELVVEENEEREQSNFVTGLAELNSRKTESGAGLHQFLSENVEQFDVPVADVIMQLAQEVTNVETE